MGFCFAVRYAAQGYPTMIMHRLAPFIIGILLIALPATLCEAALLRSTIAEPEPMPSPIPNSGTNGEFVASHPLSNVIIVSSVSMSADEINLVLAQIAGMNGGVVPPSVTVITNAPEADDPNFGTMLLSQPGSEVPPPTDRDGNPIPPPVDLKPMPDGSPNEWVPGQPSSPTSRPNVWKPRHNYPGQSPPRISWDPDGHWDADDGHGGPRIHVSPDGKVLDPNSLDPLPDQDGFVWPDPFVGIDWDTVRLYTGLGVLGAIGVVIIGFTIWIINGAGTGYVI